MFVPLNVVCSDSVASHTKGPIAKTKTTKVARSVSDFILVLEFQLERNERRKGHEECESDFERNFIVSPNHYFYAIHTKGCLSFFISRPLPQLVLIYFPSNLSQQRMGGRFARPFSLGSFSFFVYGAT